LLDSFLRNNVALTLADESHRLQVFSYCVESRSKALGHIDGCNVASFTGTDLTAIEASFDTRHYSHSRQFRSHVAEMDKFWSQLMDDCKFKK
jgi:hypothetical protein